MSNRKKYDRTDVLDRAIELFRRQGFNGTSAADLSDSLGINRKSMYAEFGSKQGLFEAALERYESNHLTRVLAVLDAEDADIETIKTAFKGYASAAEGRYRGLGCLMCNTAVERAALDEASGGYVDAYIARFTSAFETALERSKQQADISEEVDTAEVARFLTVTMIGISASIRANAPVEHTSATYHMVVRSLEALKAN